MKKKLHFFEVRIFFASVMLSFLCNHGDAQSNPLSIDWSKTAAVSKTNLTLQLVENPMVRNSSPIHKATFKALENLGADYVRYVPWFPYPKMAVAELKPPTDDNTFWDFTYLDSTMEALMDATKGHSVVINFSTTPAWMWKTDSIVTYPDDAYKTCWDYNQGTKLKDTTLAQLTNYYIRLFEWYTKGGFTDELGHFHKSGHFYKIPYWEVLNEPDLEHNISAQLYTRIYDKVVIALKKISPETKFIGMSLAYEGNPSWFEYFLNPANHSPEVGLEGISYHFYGTPDNSKQTINCYQYSFFNQANGFLDRVRYIESIRKRLSPNVFTTINEVGNILSGNDTNNPILDRYWNLSGAMFAYIYVELANLGVDVVGESQLVGYPTQFPSVSMMDWKNGKPNARYWVLKLLHENFEAGDTLVNAYSNVSGVIAQGFITKNGKKLLLINKDNEEKKILLPSGTAKGAVMSYVDITTRENAPGSILVTSDSIRLQPFAVAVIKFKD